MAQAHRHTAWVALLLILPMLSWLSSTGGCPLGGMGGVEGASCAIVCARPQARTVCGAPAGATATVGHAHATPRPMACCSSQTRVDLILPASLLPVVPSVVPASVPALMAPVASMAGGDSGVPRAGWSPQPYHPPQA